MQPLKNFKSLYLKYYPTLLVYGRTITVDEALIEDTIQELFITFWQKREALAIQSSLENYIFVAFRNNLIRNLKKRSHIDWKGEWKEELLEATSEVDTIAQERQLKEWIAKLPPSQKEVLFLRYYQNKSYLEIAELLGISYQVARNFSYRALKFLKRNVKRMYSIMMVL